MVLLGRSGAGGSRRRSQLTLGLPLVSTRWTGQVVPAADRMWGMTKQKPLARRWTAPVLTAVFVAGCATFQPASRVDLVLVGGHLLDVESGQVLTSQDVWIAGLEGRAEARSIYEADLDMPLALVVGSEGQGLRRLVRQRCDFFLRLPMRGQVGSLNASVAGSVALYEVWRRRGLAI